MDSGAFSAWSKGVSIDLDAYIAYCLEHVDAINYIVNLDVIPARPGQKKIPVVEIERSAKQGWSNYKKMVNAGLPADKIIHVFHQNEDFKWLDRMVESGMPYIGLSPANDRTRHEKVIWLDQCMKHVLDKDGMPLVKFHGFAVTSFLIMKRYPWYSVDSSTWAVAGGRGETFIPVFRDGAFIYSLEPHKVSLSQMTNKKTHFNHRGSVTQDLVLRYLDECGLVLGSSTYRTEPKDYVLQDNERQAAHPKQAKNLGINLPKGHVIVETIVEKGVINDYPQRFFLNARFLKEFEKTCPPWPWAWKSPAGGGLM